MSHITVIHHSADYDGIFCREIARKFLPDAKLIGWDFADPSLLFDQISEPRGDIYVLDLPVDRIFGFDFRNSTDRMKVDFERFVWIDHHASSIASHPKEIPGYRIDGVAACRLAWQWFWYKREGFLDCNIPLPTKQQFINREILESIAVRLAGEYDVWDHRGDGDVEFQFGLDATPELDWEILLSKNPEELDGGFYVQDILKSGLSAMECYRKRDADILRSRSFLVDFEGLKFLALTTARCNSNTFAARDIPETGHDALMAFYYNGRDWNFSLYHAAHRKDLDLSQIAVKYGGGGHRGACGFRTKSIPFLA